LSSARLADLGAVLTSELRAKLANPAATVSDKYCVG
jgi:hypothetical protein